ncbi:MAG: PLDc N-terminal domain-containing protein [Desulfovibrionaceae bacterium]|jgi:hypothetical protein|nr:PLDc N-terminal domain-containing protein [Desulfovibrionaceae bacterium]
MTLEWWYIPLLILPMLPNLWSIWHVWSHDFADMQQKMLWLLLPVFLPCLGGLIYIVVGRKKALAPTSHTKA